MPRRDREGDKYYLEVNLTPLLDVVLQLITFFMMLVHVGTQIESSDREVRLPVAPAALPGAMAADDRLVVAIDAAGRLVAGGREIDSAEQANQFWLDQARRRLRGTASLGQAGEELPTQVIVRADRDAPYGAVRANLATAQRSGFARFSLVVLMEEGR